MTATTTPRELEAHLLLKAATRIQILKDTWPGPDGELAKALTYNRKLWTILSTSATSADNPLPQEIKNNVASLGLFIMKRTMEIEVEPKPEKLSILVTINRNLAAGLAGRG